jgi:hypothetical protein
MHLESVLPHSRILRRPSYTVSKAQSAEAVAEMQRVFDSLWDEAKEPKLSDYQPATTLPRLKLSYARERTQKRAGGFNLTFLSAINDGGNDLSGVQVKLEESQFRKDGSDSWEGTSIVARTNMSWAHLPDSDPQKYSTMQLAPGPELVDFISGPRNFSQGGQTHLGFVIRIDPRHWGNVNPAFWEKGTYKFAMQVSATNVEKPGKLILFVDWDEKNLVIRSDNPSQVLESFKVLQA